MDDRGNTTKASYSNSKRSTLAYVLFAMMFVMGAAGVAMVYKFAQNGATPAATFTPMLSSPLAHFGSKCTVIPDAEDFTDCSTGWEDVSKPLVLRCLDGYGNIEVNKVRDGETMEKSYRDMALVRHECKGLDTCTFTLSEMQTNDDGMSLDSEPLPEETGPEIEPETIIDDVAGIDSNGQVLMKHHKHHHHNEAGKTKMFYQCEKLEEGPFAALETFFNDILGPGELIVEEVPFEEIGTEEIGTEEIAKEEVPIMLSKKHGHCQGILKNLAQDWDAGAACGTSTDELTLRCDTERTGARIFVLNVHPKKPKTPSEPIIEDTGSSVDTEPFLAKRGHGHKHQGRGKEKNKQQKQWGLELTDACSTSGGECKVVLNVALGAAIIEDPEITETTAFHVKFMCSYDHVQNQV